MNVPLRVLILEDRPADAELIIYELKRAGYSLDWKRVDSRLAYQESLKPDLDLIIADFSLPQFDALSALDLLKQQAYDIPFVVVSGSISEEVAVEMMKQGAADYLLKDRLARLGQAVANALQQKRERDERLQHQRELETIASVSVALRTAPDRTSLIAAILDQVDQLLQAEGSAMSLKEQNSDDLVTVLANGKLAQINGLYTPAGYGISDHALQTGQVYVAQDFSTDRYAYHKELFGDIKALACAPLITQGQKIGVLITARQTAIDDHQAHLLALIANIAANAIQRTSLHEATQRHAHQMAAVSEVGRVLSEKLDKAVIYQHLDHYLYELIPGITSIFISSYHEEKQQFVCEFASVERQLVDTSSIPPANLVPPGHGMQSEVIYSHQPLIINDLEARLARIRSNVTLVGTEGALPQSGLYAPMLVRDAAIGVIQVQSNRPNQFTPEDAEALSLVANTAAAAIENARLLEDLQRSNQDLVKAYDTTLEGWARALDLRDHETDRHTERVAEITVKLGEAMGISGDDLVNLKRGALLHDFGKVGIPDGILLKAGPLSQDEMEIMRRHPQYIYDLMQPIEYLRGALDVPYCHHEKWDGSGYPRGLQGENIPLLARIFAVVDVWDALCSDRVYRRAWSETDALAYIRDQSGRHFDPAVVAAFLKMIGRE